MSGPAVPAPRTVTTATTPAAPGVLTHDITGGVLGTLRRSRSGPWPHRDRDVLADHRELWSRVAEALPRKTCPPGAIADWFASLGAAVARNPPLLRAALYAPELLIEAIPSKVNVPADDTVGVWMRLCWISEAIRRGVNDPQPGAATGDVALLRPLAARLRFRVLSEPFRHRAEAGPWTEPGNPGGAADDVAFAFGPDSWHSLVAACRDARQEWLDHLDTHQSHPLLDQASPEEIEAELDTVAFTRPGSPTPLVVRGEPLTETIGPSSADTAVAAAVIEGHFLPRFRLAPVLRLAVHGPRRRGLTAAAVPAAAAIAVLLLSLHQHLPAIAAACGCYALIGAGTLAFDQFWAAAWLLRLPAAGAIGLVALIPSLPAGWTHYRLRWPAAALLLAVAYGYLLVEARNHRVAAAAAALRALAVTAIGAAHALLVSFIGLDVIAPAFTGSTPPLDGADGWSTLGFAAPWCLAVGVFSQILWDDRPVTAPLAHTRWRGSS